MLEKKNGEIIESHTVLQEKYADNLEKALQKITEQDEIIADLKGWQEKVGSKLKRREDFNREVYKTVSSLNLEETQPTQESLTSVCRKLSFNRTKPV
ncbi:MAG: hypothetical protein IBX57_00605 [Gammaproteobacteria bacterium]|nr:hypothetical protein [Gammaproteobacteria bacterium]